MMNHKIMKHIIHRHHINPLNKHRKLCIASIIGCTFMRGIFIGMYLSRK